MKTCLLLLTGLLATAAALPPPQSIVGGGGSGQYRPEIAEKRYCDGPCPADCGELLDDSRQCFRCQCGPELQLGDVVVAIESPCPAGLREGPPSFATKVCLGQGCTPDATWKVHHDGCSVCVCTKDGEPACTPCKRVATKSTVTCEDGLPECPQDCGQVYNAEKDCFDCPCGVGQTGDVTVSFGEPCPPGTDFREAGAFFKACGPLDTLPKGDTKICDSLDCPADCGTVRVSRAENCVYCQCGPELAPGDEVVPIDQECSPRLLPGPTQLVTKVCRAPTRQECVPYTTYNLNCDICICQQDGVPACTARDCSLPKYGDLQVCDAQYRECPADCGTAGSDNYCQFCQCGPRLDEGDIVIPIDKECPTGFVVKETQFATKTCSPAPGCQYGPAYIDECSNTCRCTGGGYACDRKACMPGQTAGKPLSCGSTTELPRVSNMLVFCHEDIVKIQPPGEKCVPNSWFMDAENCNRCTCGSTRVAACTLKACLTYTGPGY